MTEEVFNAADPKKVRKREDKAKLQRDQLDAEFKALLELPHFRRWLWQHICEDCEIYQTPFSPNGSIFAMNSGRQSVGLEMFDRVLKADPKLVPQMMLERAEWEK